jgi:putative ABC transport system permease protein
MAEPVPAAPALARWLLRRLCDPRHRDIVEGDVDELFVIRTATLGRPRAVLWACRDAISVSGTAYARPTLNSRQRQETVMHFVRDLRHAGRALVRTPAFSVVVLATLALAIGANTVIFSVVDGVLLSPLPYDDPAAIVVVQQHEEGVSDEGPSGASQDLFLAWRETGRSFSQLAMYSQESATMTSTDEPVRMNGVAASPALFAVLRVDAAVGRVFAPDAEQPGNDDGILLSHRAWQRYFGGDRAVLGTALQLDSRLRNVIGVMPAGFAFPDASVDYWVPMLATPPESMSIAVGADETPPAGPQGQQQRTRGLPPPGAGGPASPGGPEGPGGEGPEGPEEHMELWGRVVGRLAAGVTPAMASEEGATLAAGLYTNTFEGETVVVDVTPMQEQMVGAVRGPLTLLMGAVGFVLLIACANIANLVLARSVERRKETAVRAAIGAGLGNLVRYTLAESVLLSVLGGVLGVGLAMLGLQAISAMGPDFIPRLDEVSIDPRVLGFTLLVTAATALIFGLVPARGAAKLDLNKALKEDTGSGGMGRSGFRRVLVTTEIALAVVLLIGAGLLVSSFIKLTSVDLGYDSENLLHLNISLPATAYPDATAHLDYYDELIRRLEALPGVASATVANRTPYAPANIRVAIGRQSNDEAVEADARPVPVGLRMVENRYFDTLRVSTDNGRVLNRDDRPENQQVAVLSAAGAAAMFGSENPVGEQMDFIGGTRLEIVGVVPDARTAGVDPTPQADIFLPYRQAPAQMVPMLFRTAEVLVRTEPAPLTVLPAVRGTLRDLDRQVLVLSASTVRDRIADTVAEPRFYAMLVAAFALLSLTLAAVGIYGMLAYMVQQGVRDTAIRRALGAPVRQLLAGVVREGMGLAVIGLVTGVVGAYFLTQTMESMLYEIEPTDPASFAAVSVVFLAVALLAIWVPARRATRVDPMEVLRNE